MSPRRLPIFLDLSHRRILIVGGGRAAARKLPSLLATGARITLIAPRILDSVRQLLTGHEVIERVARPEDVTADFTLFFPLTDHDESNRVLTTAARKAGILVSGCSDRQNSDFFMAAVVERDPIRLAVSTDGHDPALAREAAAWLRATLPTPLPMARKQDVPSDDPI